MTSVQQEYGVVNSVSDSARNRLVSKFVHYLGTVLAIVSVQAFCTLRAYPGGFQE